MNVNEVKIALVDDRDVLLDVTFPLGWVLHVVFVAAAYDVSTFDDKVEKLVRNSKRHEWRVDDESDVTYRSEC